MADLLNHLWQSTLFAAVIAPCCTAFRAIARGFATPLARGLGQVPCAVCGISASGTLVQWQQVPAPMRSVLRLPSPATSTRRSR